MQCRKQYLWDSRLHVDNPALVAPGKTFLEAAIAILRRRMIEPRSHSLMPFHPIKGTEATLADIQTFLDGAVDTDLVLAYAQPLMALRWKTLKVSIDHPRVDVGAMVLFSLFRLMHQPASIREGKCCLRHGAERW